jgi:hypothetical protein
MLAVPSRLNPNLSTSKRQWLVVPSKGRDIVALFTCKLWPRPSKMEKNIRFIMGEIA